MSEPPVARKIELWHERGVSTEGWRKTRAFLTALPRATTPVAMVEVLDYQLAELRRADAELVALLPTKSSDESHVLAREHYFATWDQARACDRMVEPMFEAAADAIVDGDLATLRRLLGDDPSLVRSRSPYGHRGTLLHHVAANGIEICRQWQSPANAPEIARVLLEAGAEVDALATMYGSADTTLTLLVSSAHPALAGVQPAVIDVLVDAGASLELGAPLWTAIVSGYQHAVDRLVARGAAVDNLVLAACANDLDRMRSFLGSPGPSRCGTVALDPAHVLEYATIYAAALGRREAVALLLEHRPDLAFRDPVHHSTALGAARYPHPAAGRPDGNPDVVALLVSFSGTL